MKKKIIFIILDGLGDRPIKKFNGKTPLEKAKTSNLDRLAKKGVCGKMIVIGKGIVPHSDDAHLTIFGYDIKKDYPGRGPIEAFGIGMKLKQGDLAFRSNIATVDKNFIVKDRRAGRPTSTVPFASKLDGIVIDGIKFIVKPGTGYRMIIVMRGKGLSSKISDSDPKKVGRKVLKVKPLDKSKQAKFTADVMNKFLEKAHKILKDLKINKQRKKKGLLVGNYVLVRGVGHYKKEMAFSKKVNRKACCIAGAGLYKGIGAILGMDVLKVKGATGLPNTNVKAKFLAAKKALKKYGFVFVHVKPTDSLGEDGNVDGKTRFTEKIDKALKVLMNVNAFIAITADHSTPCECKTHSADPVPLLFYEKGIKADDVRKFGEKECKKGSLGMIYGRNFLKTLLKYSS